MLCVSPFPLADQTPFSPMRRPACSRGLKRKQLSTREMIQRDRNLERLGLYCAAELPKPGAAAMAAS